MSLLPWIYKPVDIPVPIGNSDNTVDYTLQKVIIDAKSQEIPYHIVFLKIVEYLIIKGFLKDKVIEKLYQLHILKVDQLDKAINIIDVFQNYQQKKDLSRSELDKIVRIKYIQYHSTLSHTWYPLPDPIKGRPSLEWKYCAHDGCDKTFTSCTGLVNHLKHYDCYAPGYHVQHEQAVWSAQLTPEKVLKQKMTKCPSIVCRLFMFKSPEELCDHLMFMGIAPFWKPGMIIKPPEQTVLQTQIQSIYFEEECIICTDNQPSVLFLPCNHCIMCFNCCDGISKVNKCPKCRGTITGMIVI